ncbi:MAG: hypothetical protein R3F11_04460 [Verrucomicrobiales bacterium]
MNPEPPSLIKRLQRRVDELIVQLDLGKAEALDYAEARKADLAQLAAKVKDKVPAPAASALHQKLDELRLQLALGKMESRDALAAQREKIGGAIERAKDALDPVEEDLRENFDDAAEALQATLDALAFDVTVGEAVAGDELKFQKEAVQAKLHGLKTRLHVAANDKAHELEELGKEAREALADIRSNLRQLFL